MLDIGLFCFVWKENSRGDSDEYHRFLQFLILDLHKSEVGPSNICFPFFFFSFFPFFFRYSFLSKNKNIFYFSGPFYPSTPGLKLCCQ